MTAAVRADLRGSAFYSWCCLVAMLAGLALFAAAVAAEAVR
jgi:hypothetical protein